MSESPKFQLDVGKLNDLQVDSIRRLIQRSKHAHYTNVYLRINGKDELYEADWLKHLVERK